jgi:cob(I)alamin adenosyltransferase
VAALVSHVSTRVYDAAVKVYTRTGDDGQTSLLSGGRVDKDDVRIEAYGSLDELNAVLGLLRCEPLPVEVETELAAIQSALFDIGCAIADARSTINHDSGAWDPGRLESWIDSMDAELDSLRHFILPGGSRGAALAHMARTVCRRGERRLEGMAKAGEALPPLVLAYVNRLSDALFTLARLLNHRLGAPDRVWQKTTDRR